MTSVTFLGTSSGNPEADRFLSSILLKSGEMHVLVDTGEPSAMRLKSFGVPYSAIDAVFITHAHADHVGGLPMILQSCLLAKRKHPLSLWMPKALIAPFTAWTQALFLTPEALGFSLEIHGWENGSLFSLGMMEVTAIRNTHMDGVGGDSFCLQITTPDGRMIFSGDLGKAGDLEALISSPLDLLVCELAHFSPDDLIKSLANAKIESLCLTHLAPELSEVRPELRMKLEEKLSGVSVIYLPEDGFTFDL